MHAVFRLLQFITRPSGYNFNPMLEEKFQDLRKRQNLWLTVNYSQHVNPKTGLHRCVLIKITQDHIWVVSAFDLDINTHSLSVRFIPQVGNTIDLFLTDQFCDFFKEHGLVDHERKFGDDQRLSSVLGGFGMGFGTDPDHSPSSTVGLVDALFTNDRSTRREVRSRNEFHQ